MSEHPAYRAALNWRLSASDAESLLDALAELPPRDAKAPAAMGRPSIPVANAPQECCVARPFSGGWCSACYQRRRARYLRERRDR